jgi:hypothetical protein
MARALGVDVATVLDAALATAIEARRRRGTRSS